MSQDIGSSETGSTCDDIRSFSIDNQDINDIDSINRDDDDYMLRDENDPLTKAMTIGSLGFGLNNNEEDEDDESASTAEDINTFDMDTQNLSRRSVNNNNNNNNKMENEEPPLPELTKKETIFWSPHMKKERRKIFFHFLFINLIILIFCFTALVIIWGSTYKTSSYYHKVKIIALIQDDIVVTDNNNNNNNNNILPMTSILPEIIETLPGTWNIFNTSTFSQVYNVNTTEQINERMIKLIYDEKYWLALNVKPNVTQSLYNSLTNPVNVDSPFNSTNFFQVIYESARDPIHVHGFMVPFMTTLEQEFQKWYSITYIPSLINNITTTISNYNNIPQSGHINFEFLDYRPYYDRILFIVAQIACVFALIFTVFQFIAYSKLHGEVTSLVKRRHKIYYRIGLSVITHFISSLFWCTVHAVYQVDFTKAFGRGGFMVCWMTTWLFMWAVGGINENVLSIIFAVNPPFLGFWVLGFVIINLASTFFPFVLNNDFYRYGYFLPLHNFVDITRVIFMDISKHHMGRNYGVLVAWIALNTAILPFDMKLVDWLVKRKQMKGAK